MEENHYNAGRPNFLRTQPGLLDFLYTSWCKASTALGTLRNGKPPSPLTLAPEAAPQMQLPPYVAFVDDDIVCIQKHKKDCLIDEFCERNNLDIGNLYIAVARVGYIGLKRDVLENLLVQASEIFAQNNCDWSQRSYAHVMLTNFDFLHAPTAAQPKTAHAFSPWERHNQ